MFINYYGKIYPSDQPLLTLQNRSFRYGDGFFESMVMFNGKLPFLSSHVERIGLSLQLLRMEPSTHYTILFFEKQIKELAEKNDLQNARVRITFWRQAGGLYAPEENIAEYAIEMQPLEQNQFVLNETGLVIDTEDIYRKDFNILSALKSTSALTYVMASQYKKEKNLDDVLILNSHGRIVEATASNIIIYKNNILYTPAFTEGCVAGIMKEVIISLANKLNIDFLPAEVEPDFAKSADEIYLTNAVKGLQWVGKWGENFYKNDLAKQLMQKLNEEYTLS